MALRPVNDPQLLEQLNQPTAGRRPVSDPELLAQLNAPEPEKKTDWLRQAALLSRAAAEGVVNTLALPFDMKEQALGPIRNVISEKIGLPQMPDMTISGLMGRGLDAAGAYTPETKGEEMASAITRGTTGALAGGGLGGANTVAAALRTGVSGATGAGASEWARQQGMGPLAQVGFGLAGGLAPGAIEEAARLGVRTATGIARPLTRSGQEQMAANVIAGQADDAATAAAKLETAAPIVPGSPRTAGEASQDIGLLSLEKGVRARDPSAFGRRVSEQNTARQTELSKLAGTEADIDAAKLTRDAITAPMREEALNNANTTTGKFQELTQTIEDRFRSKASALQDKGRFDTQLAQMKNVADRPYLAVRGMPRVPGRLSPHADRAREAASASDEVGPIIAQRQDQLRSAQQELASLKASGASPLEIERVTNKIDGILKTPGMRASQVVEKAMLSIRERLKTIAAEDGTIDARDLYTVRKELGNYIQQAAKDSASWDKRLTSGLQMELQHSIDDAIENSAPGFKEYLSRYREMSKPIDQMKVLQEIQRRSQLSSADVTTGQEFLGAGKFDSALKQALQKNGAKLTAEQVEKLKAIRTDLQYGQAINSPLVKAPGSDTFQNLSIAQVVGTGGASVHPALRVLARPLDWIYRIAGTDEKVNQIIADAMLDPKLAAQMLRRATPDGVQKFSEALRVRSVQTGLGTAGGLSSTLRQSPEDKSSSRIAQ